VCSFARVTLAAADSTCSIDLPPKADSNKKMAAAQSMIFFFDGFVKYPMFGTQCNSKMVNKTGAVWDSELGQQELEVELVLSWIPNHISRYPRNRRHIISIRAGFAPKSRLFVVL
jgi:hypothetical protein